MKIDMSRQAVTSRLKTLDELWILSVKLMNSKKIKIENGDKGQSKIKAEDFSSEAKKSQI